MSNYNPYIRLQNAGGSLKILFADNSNLTRDKRFTFLTEDIVSAGSTFRIQSLVGFENPNTSSGQIVMIGEPGQEKTEIRRTSLTAYPSESYKEITLHSSDTLKFDHPQDTKVYIIDWDRVEFNYAASATGTKTTFTTYPTHLQPDQKETQQKDITEAANRVGAATAFYFARYNSTLDSRNSGWSDALYGAGFDDNMVGAIKRRALEDLGEEVDGTVITHEFLNKSLWEARREYHKAPGKRPFRRKYNAVIGTALTGSYRIELPTDVEKPYGAENIYGVRIGTEANMDYYDKKEWDFDYRNIPHSYLVAGYTVNTTQDLYLNSVRDFEDSGAVTIEGTSIEYSARGISGGTLRISAHGDWSCSSGSDVWQNASYGLPNKFAVWADPAGSAHIYFNRPLDTAYVNQNIFADYYTALLGYDSDGDTLDEPDYDMYVSYLKAKIKARKNKGETDITKDPDYLLFLSRKNTALSTEYLSADIRIAPDVDHLDIPE